MSEVEKYVVTTMGLEEYVSPMSGTPVVMYADYAALAAENKRLREAISEALEWNSLIKVVDILEQALEASDSE
jgi:hypothetical protein